MDHQCTSREVTPDCLVLASLVGTPISAQNLIRGFKRLRERAGLPADTRIHDIRHGSASHLIADGDIATTSRIFGHSNAYVTLAIYATCFPMPRRAPWPGSVPSMTPPRQPSGTRKRGRPPGTMGIRGKGRVGGQTFRRETRRSG